jgi:hypothetical protein
VIHSATDYISLIRAAGSRQVKDVNASFVGASAPIATGITFLFVREPY